MTSTISYPAHVTALKPYIPGVPISDLASRTGLPSERIIKLASNENPLGASPKALAALAGASIDISRYPDSDCASLSAAIAKFHDVPSDWVLVGAGSESVLGNAVSTLLEPRRMTSYSQYSFQAYVNAVQKVGAGATVVPSSNFHVDLQGLEDSIASSTALVYIANPGNPTGTAIDPQALKSFIGRISSRVVVLLDEAYFEFLPARLRGDSIAWVREYPNLLVTRTFSKAYGLAGLRVGYGIAQPGLTDVMRRVRSPFTVTEAAQIAAAAALEDQAFIRRTVDLTNEGREVLVKGLMDVGHECIESHTNFVLANVNGGVAFAKRMESSGLIVRPVGAYGLANWVRISIGTAAENETFVKAINLVQSAVT